MTKKKLFAYGRLMRLHKPIGTLLLLWPTLCALWLSTHGTPQLSIVVVFVCGVFVMRSAGCVINDFADRRVDGLVKRTSDRPLPNGDVTEKESKWLFVFLIGIAFLLVLALNRFAIMLSFVAAFWAIIYPFMKRVTHLPQAVLGFAFGWSIPMVYAATSNYLDFNCLLLFLVNLCWTIAYDTQYAMVDKDDDLAIGLKSTAILFGKKSNTIILLLQVTTLVGMSLLGYRYELQVLYYIGIAIICGLFAYQYRLMREGSRESYFQAFMNNNSVGGIWFLFLFLSLL